MKKKNNGFTLIELMVAVGLMVLLLGIVFNIFTSASEVMTRTEATMEMFQNARVIFDIMSQDLTNAREITFPSSTDNSAKLILTTTTSWIENNTQTIGSAQVTYLVKKAKEFASKQLYYLQRKIEIKKPNTESYQTLSTDIIGEYLVAPYKTDSNEPRNIPFYVEAFTYNKNSSNNDISKWELKTKISNSDDVPPAVRVTMTLADEFLRNKQTFSRVFWIPQGK